MKSEYENQYVLQSDLNPQAVYAKVQRRPRSPMYGNGIGVNNVDIVSNSSKEDGTRYSSFHVTLYKDKVYDDYGFSVSDGLYERGVYGMLNSSQMRQFAIIKCQIHMNLCFCFNFQ